MARRASSGALQRARLSGCRLRSFRQRGDEIPPERTQPQPAAGTAHPARGDAELRGHDAHAARTRARAASGRRAHRHAGTSTIPILAGMPAIDGRTQQAIVAAIRSAGLRGNEDSGAGDLRDSGSRQGLPPWYDPNDEELMANLAELGRLSDDMRRENIELFRRGVSRVRCWSCRTRSLHVPVEPATSARRHRDVQPASEGPVTCERP